MRFQDWHTFCIYGCRNVRLYVLGVHHTLAGMAYGGS